LALWCLVLFVLSAKCTCICVPVSTLAYVRCSCIALVCCMQMW
jgi:hypothetical protein